MQNMINTALIYAHNHPIITVITLAVVLVLLLIINEIEYERRNIARHPES